MQKTTYFEKKKGGTSGVEPVYRNASSLVRDVKDKKPPKNYDFSSSDLRSRPAGGAGQAGQI